MVFLASSRTGHQTETGSCSRRLTEQLKDAETAGSAHSPRVPVPGSDGYTSPRWSPDGRYIVAMTRDALKMVLFDFETRQVVRLVGGNPGRLSKLVARWAICVLCPQFQGRLRCSESGSATSKLDQVADLNGFTPTGNWGVWLGLDPEDSPLMLRDTGTQDVYSLDWTVPK